MGRVWNVAILKNVVKMGLKMMFDQLLKGASAKALRMEPGVFIE